MCVLWRSGGELVCVEVCVDAIDRGGKMTAVLFWNRDNKGVYE